MLRRIFARAGLREVGELDSISPAHTEPCPPCTLLGLCAGEATPLVDKCEVWRAVRRFPRGVEERNSMAAIQPLPWELGSSWQEGVRHASADI